MSDRFQVSFDSRLVAVSAMIETHAELEKLIRTLQVYSGLLRDSDQPAKLDAPEADNER